MTLSVIALDASLAKYIDISTFSPIHAENDSLLSLCMDAISYLVEKLHEIATN